MRGLRAPLAGLGLVIALGSAAWTGSAWTGSAWAGCFTARRVVLPEQAKVLPHLSNGQAGRELAEAVWRGDLAAARAGLERNPGLASTAVVDDPALHSQPDGRYGDLLTFAVARCDRALLAGLLAAGLAPDGARPGQALSLALLSDEPRLPEILLRAGASPDPQKRGGVDVFQSVAGFNHVGAAMMLLRHGLDVRWADEFGRTHLSTALAMRVYRVAELLVEAGADPWHADRGGFTPAHTLARASSAPDAAENAARERLTAAARAGGRPWPPPAPPRR